MRYCGRDFSDTDLDRIRHLSKANWESTRRELSRQVCEALNWRKVNGELKDMSCRVALLRMEKDALITLPPVRVPFPCRRNGTAGFSSKTAEKMPILKGAGEIDLSIEVVRGLKESRLWNEFIARYHYLGYKALPGAQIRYMVKGDGEVVALLGFGASAWKVVARDQFIGWDRERRERNLHLVINNARFLILPWVRSKNLATRILSRISRRIGDDWEERYGYRPVLCETFVERERFLGTSYKAANWICVGETKGRGKLDTFHRAELPVKSVWLYPLAKRYREMLVQ